MTAEDHTLAVAVKEDSRSVKVKRRGVNTMEATRY
jgi:hypothetical protein